MRVFLPITIAILLLAACQKAPAKLDLRGAWYYDFGEWGPIDTTINYTEMYFNDSTYFVQDEVFGPHGKHKYLVTSDSIFYDINDTSHPIAFYKILGFRNDTLWLIANPEILKNGDTVFYVRFPKTEVGPSDLTWTIENTDSLNEKVVIDYDRRMWKFHAFKYNQLDRYDSLTRAGYWKWTMKDINKPAKRKKNSP